MTALNRTQIVAHLADHLRREPNRREIATAVADLTTTHRHILADWRGETVLMFHEQFTTGDPEPDHLMDRIATLWKVTTVGSITGVIVGLFGRVDWILTLGVLLAFVAIILAVADTRDPADPNETWQERYRSGLVIAFVTAAAGILGAMILLAWIGGAA